jgi:RNA polymerase sigma-70 factor, ECF subfamily
MQNVNFNEGNFEKIILQHRDFLIAYARNFTNCHNESEDIVQETLLSAFKNRNSYREDGPLRAWLARILRNKFISRYRAQRRRPQVSLSSFPDLSFLPTLVSAGAEKIVFQQLEYRAIQDAIQNLPSDHRRVIEMSDLEGLSYLEISDQLGIPLGTVRSRLSRARNRIRRVLYVWRPDLQGDNKNNQLSVAS